MIVSFCSMNVNLYSNLNVNLVCVLLKVLRTSGLIKELSTNSLSTSSFIKPDVRKTLNIINLWLVDNIIIKL